MLLTVVSMLVGLSIGLGVVGPPPTGVGNVPASAHDRSPPASAAPLLLVPDVSIWPSEGIVGSSVALTGTGLLASTAYTVSWDGVPVSCADARPLISPAGVATCSFIVPPSKGGAHTVVVRDAGLDQATTTYRVDPDVSLSPPIGHAGDSITFSGSGFDPGASVRVAGLSRDPLCLANPSPFGTFACRLLLPESVSGSYTITATASGAPVVRVGATLELLPALSLSPKSGFVGSSIAIRGSGFSGDSPISVDWAGGPSACRATSDASGNLECTATVPPTTAGTSSLGAVDGKGSSATSGFLVLPRIVLSATGGVRGSTVLVTGSGFPSGLPYTVAWESGIVPCLGASPVTSLAGAFVCHLEVSVTAGGAHELTGSVGAGSARISTTAVYQVGPSLTLSKSEGAAGTNVLVTGSGFPIGSAIAVTWSPGNLGLFQATTYSGNFVHAIAIPAAVGGDHRVTAAVKGAGGITASASFTVPPSAGGGAVSSGSSISRPSIALSPYVVLAGGPIVVTGIGFFPGSPITFAWGTSPAGASGCQADASGAFECAVPSPPTKVSGPTPLTATDGRRTAMTTYAQTPSLTVGPSSGIVGEGGVYANGTGFGAGLLVTVSWSSSGADLCYATSDGFGNFQCTFTVPTGVVGGQTVSASDGTNMANALFSIFPSVLLSPSDGPVGSTGVAVSGDGFAGYSAISLSWDTAATFDSTCLADSDGSGSFTGCTFTVPEDYGGNHSLTASDGSNAAAATFTVDPSLATDRSSAIVGTTGIVVSGKGFGAFALVNVSWSPSGAVLCNGTGDGYGSFTCSFTLPSGVTGVHVLTGWDGSNAGGVSFEVLSALSVSPASAVVSGTITVTGTGFAAGSSMNVSGSSATRPLGPGAIVFTACASGSLSAGTVTSTSDGGFVCDFAVPATTADFYTITASDTAATNATASLEINASVTVSPSEGPVGTGVSFQGSGFLPNGSIGVSFGTASACSSVTSDSLGNFSCGAYTIPLQAAGPVAVAANETSGLQSWLAVTTFTVTTNLTVGLSASPNSPDVGQSVVFVATASGGYPAYGPYLWTFGDGSTASTTTSNVSHTYKAPTGPTHASVTVVDSVGSNVTNAIAFTAYADPVAGTPTASNGSVDVGQTVTISVSVSGGSGGFAYVWSGLPPGCGGSTDTVRCTPTAAATATLITATVTDSNGLSTTSSSLTFTVYADPVVTTPQATRPTVDVGQSVTLSVTASGGSGMLTYLWSGLPSGCVGSSIQITCAPDAPASGTMITATVTDSNGYAVTSSSLLFTVFASPQVSQPVADRPSADVGQSVTFTVTVSGGSGGLSYVWSGLPPGCTGSSSSVTCTPTTPASDTRISASVTDSNGVASTGPDLNYTVYADPSAALPLPTGTSADVGQSVSFDTVISGGSGSLVILWTGLPPGCSTSFSTATCSNLLTAGSFSIQVNVTDGNGFTALSGPLAFVVWLDPTVTTPIASAPSVDLGQPVTFAVSSTPGSGSLAFDWLGLPASCLGNSGSVTCQPAGVGPSSITVTVRDSNGVEATNGTLDFLVYALPAVTIPVTARGSIDVGQTMTFATTVSSTGSGGYVLAWSPSSASLRCDPPVGLAITCTGVTPGTLNLSVQITDTNQGSGSSHSATVVVLADPTVSAPRLSAAAVDVGGGLTVTADATLGAGGFEFVWKGLPSGCSSTVASFVCRPSSPGNFSLSVIATDANGFVVGSAAVELKVNPALGANLVGGPSETTTNRAVSFQASGEGGSGLYTYAWAFGDGSSGSGSTVTHPFAKPGTYLVTVWINDSLGSSVVRSSSLNVTSPNVPATPLLGLPLGLGLAVLAGIGSAAALLVLGVRRLRARSRGLSDEVEQEVPAIDDGADAGAPFEDEPAEPPQEG